MHCPTCKVKLMSDERSRSAKTKVRCIKCGREYSITRGVLKQKKKRRTKHIKRKGITITKGAPPPAVAAEHHRILKEHQRVQQQLEDVRRLNDRLKRLPKPPQ